MALPRHEKCGLTFGHIRKFPLFYFRRQTYKNLMYHHIYHVKCIKGKQDISASVTNVQYVRDVKYLEKILMKVCAAPSGPATSGFSHKKGRNLWTPPPPPPPPSQNTLQGLEIFVERRIYGIRIRENPIYGNFPLRKGPIIYRYVRGGVKWFGQCPKVKVLLLWMSSLTLKK